MSLTPIVHVFLVKTSITDTFQALDLLEKKEGLILVPVLEVTLTKQTAFGEGMGRSLDQCEIVRPVGVQPSLTSVGHTMLSTRVCFTGTDRVEWSLIFQTVDCVAFLSNCNIVGYTDKWVTDVIFDEELTIVGSFLSPWTRVEDLLNTSST